MRGFHACLRPSQLASSPWTKYPLISNNAVVGRVSLKGQHNEDDHNKRGSRQTHCPAMHMTVCSLAWDSASRVHSHIRMEAKRKAVEALDSDTITSQLD